MQDAARLSSNVINIYIYIETWVGAVNLLLTPPPVHDRCSPDWAGSWWDWREDLRDSENTSRFQPKPRKDISCQLQIIIQGLHKQNWLVVSNPLKHVGQLGWLFYMGKITMFQTTNQKNIWHVLKPAIPYQTTTQIAYNRGFGFLPSWGQWRPAAGHLESLSKGLSCGGVDLHFLRVDIMSYHIHRKYP